MTLDGVKYIDIWVTGVPDGVSPRANEAMVSTSAPYRLYIYANEPITESYLLSIDSIYGREKYPLLELTVPASLESSVALLTEAPPPETNFYTTANGEPANLAAEFIEYRYVQQRHRSVTNVLYDRNAGRIYRLALPKHSALLVLIMPRNFIRTGLKAGYFVFENNLMIRVYSKCLLSAERVGTDPNIVSEIAACDRHLMVNLTVFMNKLGIHRIYVSPTGDQIIGYDKYLKLIVGSVANVYI